MIELTRSMSRRAAALMGAIVLIAAIVSLGLPGAAQAGLIAYWNFDDNVDDQSGHGHDGTWIGNEAYDNNVPTEIGSGKALSLDNSSWITIPADPELNSSPFTRAYWVNQNGAPQDEWCDRVTSRQGFTFETAVNSNSGLKYYQSSGGWQDTGLDILPNDQWKHVAFAYDGADMRVYLDGGIPYIGDLVSSPTGKMVIGAVYYGGGTFEGLLDDMAMWDVALSAGQIASLADGSAAPLDWVPEPGTFVLAAIALLGMVLLGWRRRKRK